MNPSFTPSRKSWPRIFLFAAFFLGAANAAHAQSTIWANPGADDWFDGGNWNNGVPTSSDLAIIRTGGTSQIATGGVAEALSMNIGTALGSGTLQITNGSLQVGSHISLALGGGGGTIYVSGSTASMTQTGGLFWVGGNAAGVLTVRDGGSISNASSFGLTLGNVGGSGTLNIEGTSGSRGALETHFIEEGSGSGEINIDGGILRALSSQSDFLQNFDAGDVTINGGGAFIDSNGFNIGISAAMDGGGVLTKIGAGTLTLSGANTYTGGTTVKIGTLAVNGGGSITHTGAEVRVGDASGDNGTLTIGTGGTVSSVSGHLGFNAGSEGTANVNGGTWTNSDDLYVGGSGTGTLNIENSGTVSNSNGHLGFNTGSEGTANVNGGAWTNTSYLFVGYSGTGTLNIGSGGTVSSVSGHFGEQEGSAGTANVNGGTWTNSDNLMVGHFGTGTLTIENGGTVSNSVGYLGFTIGSEGTANVDGGAWTNTSYLVVGDFGTGTLNIQNGGMVSALSVHMATGAYGIGSLLLESGGVLGTSYIEEGSGSGGGSIDFDGGILRATANETSYLRNFESGDVTLNAGGAFIDSNGFGIGISAVIDGAGGLTKQGAGTLTLTGANTYTGGTTLEQGTLEVGNNGALGTGTLTVNGGTLATDGNDRTISNDIVVADNFSIYPKGVFLSSSTFALNGDIDLGAASRTITDAANFSATEFGEIHLNGAISNGGIFFNATGELAFFILGGAQANTYSDLTRVGYGVSLQLLKSPGVTAIAGNAQVDDNGVIVVEANEQIADSSTLTVNDTGRLQVGAFNDVTETIGTLMGNGEVALKDNDAGSSLVIQQGTFSGQITGGVATNPASLTKTGTGTLTLSGNSTYVGGTSIDAGTLVLNGTLGDTDVTVGASAFLQGIGTAHGSVTSNGTIAPGNSPGVLTVGELVLNGTSVLDFELGTLSDRIDVVANSGGLGSSGNLTLDGTLNITNSGGFGAGTYRLIDYDGILTNNVLGFGIAPGGYDLAIDIATANQVNLNVTAVTEQYWDGTDTSGDGIIDGGDGNWDNTTTNWTNSSGTVNGEWIGRGAVFGGASGTVAVTEDVSFRAMRFEADYSLTGPGSLLAVDNTAIIAEGGVTVEIENVIGGDADASVEIRGGGVVALYGVNTYGGGTLLSEGTLRIEHDRALGTGDFYVQDGTTIATTEGFNIANRTFLQGDVTLDVGFPIGGARFSEIVLGNENRTLSIDGDVRFAGAILGGANSGLTLNSSTAASVYIYGADNNEFGSLRIGDNVVVTLVKDPGTIGISGDLRIDDGGQLDVTYGGGAAPIVATANVHLDGGLDFNSTTALNISFASLTGGATGELSNFRNFAPLNLTILSGNYAGTIYDEIESMSGGAITLIKDGDGTLTLSGVNTYSGPTLINGGRLIAASSTAISDTAVTVDGANSVLQINTGVALSNALQLDNQGTLDNFGAYTGNIGIRNGGGAIVNRNGGQINGTITANGDAIVSLYGGSTITADIDFGKHDSALILTGAGDGTLNQAIGGSITGDYALLKTGSGNWTIDRSLNPSLNTSIQNGALIIGQTGDLKGDIQNDGALVIAKNNVDYTFAGSVGGSGRVIQDGTSNTILIGELLHTGGTNINDGALTVGDGGYIQGNIKNEGKFYIDRKEEDFIFEGSIRGSGQVIHDGTSNTFLIGEQTYTGTTYVNSGGLILGNGDGKSSLAGDVIVDEDAYFGGTGVVGGNMAVAGIISAGNSPGTLTVRGNFTLESTAILLVEIDSAKDYDRLVIGGKAKLNGTLRVVLADNYDPEIGAEFDILNAKSLAGKFKSIEGSEMWDLVYGPDSLMLVLGPSDARKPYQDYANTPNQFNVAVALENLRTQDLGRNTDFEKNVRPILDALSPAELRQAFEAIIPNQSVAFSDTLFARSRSFLPQMATRLADIRAGSRGFVSRGFTERGASDMKDVLAPVPENKWGVWVDGSGVFSEVAGFDGLRTGDASTASATVGVDYRLSDNFTAGFYTGYVGSWTDFGGNSEVNSSGSRFGIYSTYQSGGFYLNNLVGGEWNAYDWSRQISFPGINRTADADTEGSVFETMFGGGYDWKVCEWGTVGAFTSLEYTLLFVDGFTETGAGALNLRIKDQDADSLRTNVGVQFTGDLPVGHRRLRPSLRAAWRHEYLDGSHRINSALVGGAGPGFSTLLPGGSREDSLLLNGGFSMDLTDNVSGYLYYTGDLAGGETENIHSVNAGLRLAF